MRRLLTLTLAVLMICTAALAEAPVFSPDVALLQKANNALMDKYGHTHATLGLFEPHLTNYGETTLITYTVGGGNVPECLAGKYLVLITSDSVQAYWSHDNADAALWQSGDLNSSAWGVKQLTAYLDESPMTRMDFCDPYEEVIRSAQAESLGSSVPFNEVSRDNRTAAEAASETARKAVQMMYDLPDEVASRLDWYLDLSSVAQYPDGHTEWHIMLQDNADVLDPTTYYVTLNAETQTILRITYFSGGVG